MPRVNYRLPYGVACTLDPYYYGSVTTPGRTVLLMHGESVVDSSAIPKTITNSGVTVTSSFPKFGTGSMSFDGNSYAKTTTLTDFQFASGDYTVEAWIYANALTGQHRHLFNLCENLTGGFAYMDVSVGVSGNLRAQCQPATGGAATVMNAPNGTIPLNTWKHVLFCRYNGTAYLYADGELMSTYTGFPDFPAAKVLNVGIGGIGNGYTDATVGRWNGYVDELRVTKGVARVIPGFTPPTSAFPDGVVAGDPYFANVVALVRADGANGSTSVPDSSSYARTYTISGAANLSTTVKKFGTASLYLSSTEFGAYFYGWPSSADFNLSGIDFTIEMWAYELSGSNGSLICRRPGGQALGWAFTVSGLRAHINGVWSDTQISWTRPSQNAWHHYALVCKSGTLYAYVDGVLQGTKSGVTSISDQALPVYVGQADNASENKFLGYIDDIRITRGVGRYFPSFTPPTSPYCNYGDASQALTALTWSTISSGASNYPPPGSLHPEVYTIGPYAADVRLTSQGGSGGDDIVEVDGAGIRGDLALASVLPEGTIFKSFLPAGSIATFRVRNLANPLTSGGVWVLASPIFEVPQPSPYPSSVVFACDFNATEGSSSFVDTGVNNNPIVVTGSVTALSAAKLYGTTGARFAGGAGDYITITHPSLTITGDYTIEWSMNTADTSGAVFRLGNEALNRLQLSLVGPSGGRVDPALSCDMYNQGVVGVWQGVPKGWTSFCFQRSGSTVKLFINGQNAGTITLGSPWANVPTHGNSGVMVWGQGSVMDLDNVRVTSGVALYSSDYVLPYGPFTT